jgi:hypothetical protein
MHLVVVIGLLIALLLIVLRAMLVADCGVVELDSLSTCMHSIAVAYS